MRAVRWWGAGICLLAAAVPAMAQRGQYDDRDARYGSYERDDRDARDDRRYDRDDRDRGDRYGNRRDDRRDRDRGDRWGGGRGPDQPLPGGSWAQSCRRSGMSGSVLSAQCKDQRGKWRDTQINPRSCQTGRVGNRFGTLACE